jgi:hypothetical protein
MNIIMVVGWFAVIAASYIGAEWVLKISGKL